MAIKILLVNPPIYDFSAYDFWLKPYGLLSVAGNLRSKVGFKLFDYLDRLHPFVASQKELEDDQWGRGRFYCEQVPNPPALSHIPRYFRRFGLPRSMFEDFLTQEGPFDFVLIQTMMTYWYQGVREVIEDIRKAWPQSKIILGGNYVTLCGSHAKKLGADFLLQGTNLQPLWQYLNITGDLKQPTLWELYDKLNVGVLKLTDGCPFNCTYCSVPKVYGKFKARPLDRSLAELELLTKRNVENVAFYDDALLFEVGKILIPFLEEVLKRGIKMNLHTPNGLHARFITRELARRPRCKASPSGDSPQQLLAKQEQGQGLARLMVQTGFKTFYLGFESASLRWQKRTSPKVFSDKLARAVEHLTTAGAEPKNIIAYQILGHPYTDIVELEDSMRFVNSLGIRGMLADFSPIPGTPDGEYCRKWVDMDEPLFHNKTAFPIILLGFDEVNRLKDLQRELNRNLPLCY